MFLLRSVRNWLTLLFLVLIAAASLTSWLYVVPPLKSRLVQQKLKDLTANSNLIVNKVLPVITVTPKGYEFDPVKLASSAYDVYRQTDARIAVIDSSDEKVLTDTSPGGKLTLKDFPMIERAASSLHIADGIVTIADNDYAAVAVPIIPVDEDGLPLPLAAVVLISSSLRDVYSAVSLVERQIILATVLAVAVTLVAAYLVSHLIARRLKLIERSAEAIAGGDFEAKVQVRVRDEIGQLADTFNTMGGRLRQAFSAIEHEKQSAEAMLNSLDEGIIGMSPEGIVVMANPAAARFLGPRLAVGDSAVDAFPEEVHTMWTELRFAGADEPVVFELGSRTFEALVQPVGKGTELDSIVVLRDITHQARLERARRDFVANASHEFKTPLFSLSGFLELLDEEGIDEEERQEFLALMKEQVERLQALSLSLLDLSQVDAGAVRMSLASVDLSALAHSVAAEFQARAADKRVDVAVATPPQTLVATCDEERLAQVLRALLDNALKFTGEGGAVGLSVAADGHTAAITVADTGGGIPAAELPRVFDRFYRGAMTRGSKPGTGLGLSIARDLTQLMGGTLTADSRLGQGSTFTLRLPLDGLGTAADA